MHIYFAPPEWLPSPAAAQIFALCCIVWIAAEIANQIRIVNQIVGRRGVFRKGKDRGSYLAIYVSIVVSLALSYGLRGAGLGLLLGLPQYIGMALMLLGVAFREWAVITLGRHFTVIVTTSSEQQLVTGGPYRWLRHPSYTGAMITILGVGLGLGTWLGALLALLVSLAGYTYRARVEEQALEERFGDTYREYMRRRWRFFPGI